jgi:FkbM family methyltransferase
VTDSAWPETLNPVMDSPAFAKLLQALGPLNCLDIGARGEPVGDLLPIAGCVNIYGFEPDAEECERLNRHYAEVSSPYRSVRFLPLAIGHPDGARTLHLTAYRGASSFLAPDERIKQRYYGNDGCFVVEREQPVAVRGLDSVCAEHGIGDAAYLKVDVEGYELEVFRSAPELLSRGLLAIRCEVSFMPVRVGQPAYCEVESFLKDYGFVPMDFLFLHHWRARTQRAQRRLSEQESRVYRRRLVHGDVLFVRDPDGIDAATEAGVVLLIREAALLYTYGFFDEATAILERPAVRKHVESRVGIDVDRVADEVGAHFARRARAMSWRGLLRPRRG